jgi:hypothetical protein
MMILTYKVIARGEWLLSVAFEVDFDLGLRSIGGRFEVPAADGVLCCGGEEWVARFNLCFGNSAIRLNGDEQDHGTAYVHAAGEFGIGRGDSANYGSMDVAGKRRSGAEEETSCKNKRPGRSK